MAARAIVAARQASTASSTSSAASQATAGSLSYARHDHDGLVPMSRAAANEVNGNGGGYYQDGPGIPAGLATRPPCDIPGYIEEPIPFDEMSNSSRSSAWHQQHQHQHNPHGHHRLSCSGGVQSSASASHHPSFANGVPPLRIQSPGTVVDSRFDESASSFEQTWRSEQFAGGGGFSTSQTTPRLSVWGDTPTGTPSAIAAAAALSAANAAAALRSNLIHRGGGCGASATAAHLRGALLRGLWDQAAATAALAARRNGSGADGPIISFFPLHEVLSDDGAATTSSRHSNGSGSTAAPAAPATPSVPLTKLLAMSPGERPVDPTVDEVTAVTRKFRPEFNMIAPVIARVLDVASGSSMLSVSSPTVAGGSGPAPVSPPSAFSRPTTNTGATTSAEQSVASPTSTAPAVAVAEEHRVYESGSVPDMNLEAYVMRIAKYGYISPAALVCALILMDRVCISYTGGAVMSPAANPAAAATASAAANSTRPPLSPQSSLGGGAAAPAPGRIVLTPTNVHKVYLAACRVGSKAIEVANISNKRFAPVGGVPLKLLNQLEARFLIDVKFETYIHPAEFQAYREGIVGCLAAQNAALAPSLSSSLAASQQQQQQQAASRASSENRPTAPERLRNIVVGAASSSSASSSSQPR